MQRAGIAWKVAGVADVSALESQMRSDDGRRAAQNSPEQATNPPTGTEPACVLRFNRYHGEIMSQEIGQLHKINTST